MIIHLLLWGILFATINVDWSSDWLDQRIRPHTPAPLAVLIFPVYVYVNAFVLIPQYLSRDKWKTYLLLAGVLFVGPEGIRMLVYLVQFPDRRIIDELFGRDSFLFGAPSAFFMALNVSFIYRLAKDWFRNKRRSQEQQTDSLSKPIVRPYEQNALLSDPEEVAAIRQALTFQLEKEEVYLNPQLSLRELAEKLPTTEKKLSFFLNQHLHSSFYELLNQHRVEKFKREVAKPENESLSIVGVALNCGFPSKSSFYRAFKARVGTSPSAYLKRVKHPSES